MPRNTRTDATYLLVTVVEVDRPELRDSTYAAVPAGHRFTHRNRYASYTQAISNYNANVRGDFDFASEFVAVTYLYQVDLEGRILRVVRRRVERTRKESVKISNLYALARAAARKPHTQHLRVFRNWAA